MDPRKSTLEPQKSVLRRKMKVLDPILPPRNDKQMLAPPRTSHPGCRLYRRQAQDESRQPMTGPKRAKTGPRWAKTGPRWGKTESKQPTKMSQNRPITCSGECILKDSYWFLLLTSYIHCSSWNLQQQTMSPSFQSLGVHGFNMYSWRLSQSSFCLFSGVAWQSDLQVTPARGWTFIFIYIYKHINNGRSGSSNV